MILKTPTFAETSRAGRGGVAPEIVDGALHRRTRHVRVRPDFAGDMRLILVQGSPGWGTVGIKDAEQILVHIEEDEKAIGLGQIELPLYPQQVRLIVYTRLRL